MVAEPPSVSYLPALYGAPEWKSASEAWQSSASSSEYSHHSSDHDDYHYKSHPVGHQSSHGLNVDPNLLNKIKHALIEHENSESSSGHAISSGYGVPSHSYGVPSHSHGISDIHFDSAWQSTPVAYYIGQKRSSQPSTNYGAPQWHY